MSLQNRSRDINSGNRIVLTAKLHRVTVTHSELHYEGSCAIDKSLLIAADIKGYEQIEIYNVTNGERFTTYAIEARQASGIISVNGAAARKAAPGDLLIIASYGVVAESSPTAFQPRLVYVDARNRILVERRVIPIQAAA